ncbi:MAG: S-layer homology domain-containing protein, partial [Oscillospiraceae bacterium]
VDVEITVTAADEGGSGVKTVTVSGGHFTNATDIKTAGKFTAAESTAGTYTYTVTVTDNAGNSASAAVTIKLDPKGGQKPVDPVSPPAPNAEIPKPDGGSVTISPENPKPGDKVIITAKPDEGKALDKITVTDKDGKKIPVTKNPDGSFRFVQPEGKVTISVSFKTSTGLPWNPFTDVKIEDWFFDSVKYVYENGLMMGTDGTSFEPDLGTSRAMIVTILWRMQGEPKAKAASDFVDVPAGAWFSEAVAWAQEQKLAAGVDEKHFEPNRNISRQELASLFYRYAVLAKLAPTGAWQVPLTYADKSKIADWAVEGAMFAQLKGFIKGRPGNIFAPNAPATRAEASSMLQRFITAK